MFTQISKSEVRHVISHLLFKQLNLKTTKKKEKIPKIYHQRTVCVMSKNYKID